MSLRSKLSPIVTNFKGISIPQKYVVIESDDWGSIRMPSKEAQQALERSGIPVQKSPYLQYDSLENNADLENLFEVLQSVKDSEGNPAVMTANTVVGNPNFKAIHDSGYTQYSVEPFTQTLARYPQSDRVFSLYKTGIEQRLFVPQFHGREHVNVPLWLTLIESDPWFKTAFEWGCWGISSDIKPLPQGSVQATFDHNQLALATESLQQGLMLFEELFGYKSTTIIPNNYIWNNELNEISKTLGIDHFQGFKLQFLPKTGGTPRKSIPRKMGEMNSFGQTYGVRNCFFEPTENGDTIDSVLWDISVAFAMKKPAILCSHRINFAGRLNPKNRDLNLVSFKKILDTITLKWPDVQFITSHQLQEIFHAKAEHSRI